MKEEQQSFDNIFHYLSQIIIVVPIIIVLLAVFLKLSGNFPLTKDSLQILPSPTLTLSNPLLQLTQKINSSTTSAKFNLKGPLICSTTDTAASMSAYVLDKKVLLTINEKKSNQNILLNEDCVYIWKQGLMSGEKICGISQYVSLAEGFLSTGFIEAGSIFNNLSQTFTLPSTDISQESMKSLFNTCVKKDIPNTVQFRVPDRVLFRNKEITLP